tara:strand:- start:270 stop:464 length:195 start_codon:yes stop_codon:yes gene_type:complete
MTQKDINAAVAKATGESRNTIAQRGFSLARWIPVEPPICPIDWDYEDSRKTISLLPDRQNRTLN